MEPVSEELSCKFKNMAIVCAILVVLLHVDLSEVEPGEPLWVFSRLIPQGIAYISVPFFFLASGYFLAGHIGEEGWWKREVLKRIRTLLVPFILWNGFFFLYKVCIAIGVDLVAHRAFGTNLAYMKSPVYFLLGLYPLKGPPLGVTWYIRMLLLLVLISPAIVWMLKQFPRVFILGAWVLSIVVFLGFGFDPSIRFLFSPEGVAYFSLGIFLRWHPVHVEGRGLWVWSGVIVLAFLVLRMAQAYTGAFIGVPLGAISIPFMMYAVWGLIPAKPWAKGFTSLAFACYVMHVFVRDALHFGFIALTRGLGLSQYETSEVELWYLLAFTAPVTLLLGYALRRCFPKTAGVLFGGR